MKYSISKKKQIFLILILMFTIVFAVGQKDYYKDISKSLGLYNNVYKQLFYHYADQLKAEEFTDACIKSMVKELDPYTVFLVKEEKAPIEMLSKGEYSGIGLRISLRQDTLTAISPMADSPAKKAGIMPGDQILKIDSVSTIGMKTNDAAKIIRGKKGTLVDLTIRRPGIPGSSVYNLKRDKIEIHDISYSGMLENGVGYIKTSGFSKGLSDDLKKVIKKFNQDDNFKSLIFDLRENPGGLLHEALEVAELFTEPGDTLLITKGRTKRSNQVYIAQKKPLLDSKIKVAVLIDRGSASASEIVSGVIQDLDRGVILGSTSFGKGLVQTVLQLDKNHSLKITNAKYYIPSGRLIQKPDYIKNPDLVNNLDSDDSLFFSRNGRMLKGGGGIVPDIKVKSEKTSDYIRQLLRQNKLFSFARNYKLTHQDLPENFEISDEILTNFKKFLAENNFTYNLEKEKKLRNLEKDLMKDEEFKNLEGAFSGFYDIFKKNKAEIFRQNEDQIKLGLKLELATLSGGLSKRIEVSLEDDVVIEKAIEVLNNQDEYTVALSVAN